MTLYLQKGTNNGEGNEAGNEREMARGGSGDADRCRLSWWGEDKGRVVSKWAASPSPTSISRHSASALPCTLYPRSYTPSLRSPWEQESSLSALEFLPPCCRADLLTPVPLPSAHHSSSVSSPAHSEWMQFLWIGQCVVNSLDSAPGGFILEMSQTASEACCGWMNSNGIPLGPRKDQLTGGMR